MATTRIHKGYEIGYENDRTLDALEGVIFVTDGGAEIRVGVAGDHLEVYFGNGTLAVLPRTSNVVHVVPVKNTDLELRRALDL